MKMKLKGKNDFRMLIWEFIFQARILYSDQRGRAALALRFNEAIRKGEISGSIVISRDHHDVRYIN